MSTDDTPLARFMRLCPPEAQAALEDHLRQEAERHSKNATQVTHDGGEDWRWRAAALRSAAHALHALLEQMWAERARQNPPPNIRAFTQP